MATELRPTLMDHATQVTGEWAKQVDLEYFTTKTVISLKETLSRIELMARALTDIWTVQHMMVTGLMICKKEKE